MYNYSNEFEIAKSEHEHYGYLFSLANKEIEEYSENFFEEVEEVKPLYAERYIIVFTDTEYNDEFVVLGQKESIPLTKEEAENLTNKLNEKYGSETRRYEWFIEVYDLED